MHATKLLPLLLLLAIGCERLESFVIKRGAARALTGDRTGLLEDGALHVVLCGTGSPLADATRASACTAVIAGGHFILVDVGPGSWREVALARLPRARLDAILLTHFHSDHIGELGEATVQSWIAGRTTTLPVYGPPGVDRVVGGFGIAYALDAEYRVAHHGSAALPTAGGVAEAHVVTIPRPDDAALVFEADGLRVTAFAVDHAPVVPAYGYRFEYRGRSVVVSGDTRKSSNLARHAEGADLLVHEALAAHMLRPVSAYAREHALERWAKLTSDILTYHTTPVEAAEIARAAHVRVLALTHVVPPLPNLLARRLFLRGVANAWDGRTVLGRDGMHLALPGGTTEVQVDPRG